MNSAAPIKVLHVVPSFYPAFVYGGPIYSVYELCAGLANLGCHVRVLTTNANGPDRVLDVPIDRDVTLPPGFSVRYCPRLRPDSVSAAFLQKLPAAVRWADLVHLTAVFSFPTFPTLFLARLFSKKVVWSPRGCLTNWAGSRRNRQKAVFLRIAQTLAPPQTVLHLTSDQELSASSQRLPRFARKVIFNGVHLPPSCPPSDNPDNTPGDPDNSLKMLFLGRIHPIKNLESLLHACALLNRPWSLAIAGSGDPSYVQSLHLLAGSLGLAHVRFLGPVLGEQKEKLLFSSDLLLLPSHTENFGMVVAEALAHGIPVIASKATPWRDLERVGCGLWVHNSPSSLASAINQLANSPRREMGRRGREWMRANYSWPSISRQMLDLYTELTAHACSVPLPAPSPSRIRTSGAS